MLDQLLILAIAAPLVAFWIYGLVNCPYEGPGSKGWKEPDQ